MGRGLGLGKLLKSIMQLSCYVCSYLLILCSTDLLKLLIRGWKKKKKTANSSILLSCSLPAQSLLMVRELKDVEVTAPDEACFECEVSVLVLKSPMWNLNGEPLQSSSRVLLEKMGTVHRLTLRQTSPDMSGLVEFTSGKAKSRAELRVKSKLRKLFL